MQVQSTYSTDGVMHAIPLSEVKWTTRPVGITVLEGLRKKPPAAIPGLNCAIHYALLSRSGFTPSPERLAAEEGVKLVSLEELIASI